MNLYDLFSKWHNKTYRNERVDTVVHNVESQQLQVIQFSEKSDVTQKPTKYKDYLSS